MTPPPAAKPLLFFTAAELHRIRRACWDGKGLSPQIGERLLDMIAAREAAGAALAAKVREAVCGTCRGSGRRPMADGWGVRDCPTCTAIRTALAAWDAAAEPRAGGPE